MTPTEIRYMELRLEGKTKKEILAEIEKDKQEQFRSQVDALDAALKLCLDQLEAQSNSWIALLEQVPAVSPASHAKVKELTCQLRWLATEGSRLQGEILTAQRGIAEQNLQRQRTLEKIQILRAQIQQNRGGPDYIPPNGPFHFGGHK